MPRVTPGQAGETSSDAPDHPILPDRLGHVATARRLEPASRAEYRAGRPLIDPDQGQDDPARDATNHGEGFGTRLPSRLATAWASQGNDRLAWSKVRAGPRGTTIRSIPIGISALPSRNASRSRRLTRFRSDAIRTFRRDADIPRRAFSDRLIFAGAKTCISSCRA